MTDNEIKKIIELWNDELIVPEPKLFLQNAILDLKRKQRNIKLLFAAVCIVLTGIIAYILYYSSNTTSDLSNYSDFLLK